MDLNKAQGRQMMPAVSKSRESQEALTSSVIRSDPDDPMTIMDVRSIPEETQALYAWLNKTIRCIVFEQYRAYLKCPVCSEYCTCAQITRKQRIELEASPFFSIKEIAWDGPRRIKNMYIAVCTDGSLRRLDNFDPKDTDGINVDQYKDVEEVLVVTKAFRRKVMWAPVPLEQVNAKRSNGESQEESKDLINKGVNTTQTKQMARKETAKPKNGKK